MRLPSSKAEYETCHEPKAVLMIPESHWVTVTCYHIVYLQRPVGNTLRDIDIHSPAYYHCEGVLYARRGNGSPTRFNGLDPVRIPIRLGSTEEYFPENICRLSAVRVCRPELIGEHIPLRVINTWGNCSVCCHYRLCKSCSPQGALIAHKSGLDTKMPGQIKVD